MIYSGCILWTAEGLRCFLVLHHMSRFLWRGPNRLLLQIVSQSKEGGGIPKGRNRGGRRGVWQMRTLMLSFACKWSKYADESCGEGVWNMWNFTEVPYGCPLMAEHGHTRWVRMPSNAADWLSKWAALSASGCRRMRQTGFSSELR